MGKEDGGEVGVAVFWKAVLCTAAQSAGERGSTGGTRSGRRSEPLRIRERASLEGRRSARTAARSARRWRRAEAERRTNGPEPSLSQYGKEPAKIVAEPPPRAQPQPASDGASQKAPRESFDPIADVESKNPGFRLGGKSDTPMQEALTGIALATGQPPDAIKTDGSGDPGGVPGGAGSSVSGSAVQSVWAGAVLLGGWNAKGVKVTVKALAGVATKIGSAIERRIPLKRRIPSAAAGVGAKALSKQAQNGIRSLEKWIAEHENKLAEFKANPAVRPGMEGQPNQVIESVQLSRIRHLEKEIQTFEENIEKLRRGD